YLESHDLKINISEEYSDTVEKGYVIRQDPAAHAELEKGSSVNVVISKGKEALPPVQHTVSFTIPYTEAEPEEGEEIIPQTVLIYIKDMENELTNVYKSEQIIEDTEFTITLMIAPEQIGEYR